MDLFLKLQNMHFLLIEDDDWIRDSLKLFFESEGCRIVAVETAEAGLDIAKRCHFDIIITDYRLPGINGIDFIKRLPTTQNGALKILITAYGRKEVMDKADSAGIDETLCKPFDSEDIERSLMRLIRDRDHCRE
jgi:DNA-binding response OmpR family regulator